MLSFTRQPIPRRWIASGLMLLLGLSLLRGLPLADGGQVADMPMKTPAHNLASLPDADSRHCATDADLAQPLVTESPLDQAPPGSDQCCTDGDGPPCDDVCCALLLPVTLELAYAERIPPTIPQPRLPDAPTERRFVPPQQG